jgi:hypothetical protein
VVVAAASAVVRVVAVPVVVAAASAVVPAAPVALVAAPLLVRVVQV